MLDQNPTCGSYQAIPVPVLGTSWPGSDYLNLRLQLGPWDYSYWFNWVWSQSCSITRCSVKEEYKRFSEIGVSYTQQVQGEKRNLQSQEARWWWCCTAEQIHALVPISGTVLRAHVLSEVWVLLSCSAVCVILQLLWISLPPLLRGNNVKL